MMKLPKDKIEKAIIKHAIINAVQHDNKANPKAIIGKIIAEFPEVKKDMRTIVSKINKLTQDVNDLSNDEQNKLYEDNFKDTYEKKQEQKKQDKEELKELPNVKKKVVLRIAPSPSGALHLGHSYPVAINNLYKNKYNGKYILRIEDTNPDNLYVPGYKLIPEDMKWMTNDNVDEIIIQSDRLELYYKYAKKLIELDAAYVCECSGDEFRKYSSEQKDCPCRKLKVKDNLKRYDHMFSKYKQGDAVIRLKTTMQHKNPAMRDFPLMRINDSEHPRTKTKYRVWPLMNLSVTVDDIETGVTHTIRGKDHADNNKRQAYIYEYLKIKQPEAVFVGRVNFIGIELSSSKLTKYVKEGKYKGWDDIRMPTLQAYKRRGYQAKAFERFALAMGVSLTDKTITKEDAFKMIDAFNKEIIDKDAKRLFAITKSKAIKIKDTPKRKIELDLHPDNHKGGRKFTTGDSFIIEKADYDNIMKNKNKLHRLMDCCNFTVEKDKFIFHSQDYEDYKNAKNKGNIMHFLPKDDYVDIQILMEDSKFIKAKAEKYVTKIKQDEIVQFERFGFCKLDNKKELEFWYTHR